ncbi:MAG: hypothetical protein ACP5OA_03740 [Candidatus Woesearchaeota archaeon]
MSRKGQAALEFMMTYGWAILVVLAAIGALSYFGVLNPARLTPETCLTSSGFGCLGKPILDNSDPANPSIAFTISNGLGYSINLESGTATTTGTFNSTACGGSPTIELCPKGIVAPGCGTDPLPLSFSGETTVVVSGCNFNSTNVVKGDIILTYTNPQSGLAETATITITVKVPK